jgi:putative FmdB family regulatory protein
MRNYKCGYCGHTWEELRRDQSDPKDCELCKKEGNVERQLSAPAIRTGAPALPHFNVAVNPGAKTQQDRFTITERKSEKE